MNYLHTSLSDRDLILRIIKTGATTNETCTNSAFFGIGAEPGCFNRVQAVFNRRRAAHYQLVAMARTRWDRDFIGNHRSD